MTLMATNNGALMGFIYMSLMRFIYMSLMGFIYMSPIVGTIICHSLRGKGLGYLFY